MGGARNCSTVAATDKQSVRTQSMQVCSVAASKAHRGHTVQFRVALTGFVDPWLSMHDHGVTSPVICVALGLVDVDPLTALCSTSRSSELCLLCASPNDVLWVRRKVELPVAGGPSCAGRSRRTLLLTVHSAPTMFSCLESPRVVAVAC